MKYFIPILILTSFHFTSYTQDCKYIKITFEVYDTVNDKPSSFLRACLFSAEFMKYPCTMTFKGELSFRIKEEDIDSLHFAMTITTYDHDIFFDKKLLLKDVINLNDNFISTYRFTLKEYKYISRKEYKGFYDHSYSRELIERFDVY